MIQIAGEPGHVLEFLLVLRDRLDGTTVSNGIVRAQEPGGAVVEWAGSLSNVTTSSLRVTYQLGAQLEGGVWRLRPFLRVGGVLVTSLRFRTVGIEVVPDPVPPP